MWGIFLITVMLIWSAMYLSFTPVGEASIAGVRGKILSAAYLSWSIIAFKFKNKSRNQ